MTDTECAIEGCEKPVFIKARGWCRPHYQRWTKTGSPLSTAKVALACQVNDEHCTPDSRIRKGLCDVHYARLKRHGDVTHREKARDRGPAEERWMKKIQVTPFGCWEWRSEARDHNGYGMHAVGGKQVFAHRYVYELLLGSCVDGCDECSPEPAIPEGFDLDHLCRNRACCNPDHLEPVPHRINVARGDAGKYNATKTFCKQRHEYTPENTYYRADGRGRGCRECARIASKAQQRQLRGTPDDAVPNGEKTHCKENHEFTPENTYRVTSGPHQGARVCKECAKMRGQKYRAAKRAKRARAKG